MCLCYRNFRSYFYLTLWKKNSAYRVYLILKISSRIISAENMCMLQSKQCYCNITCKLQPCDQSELLELLILVQVDFKRKLKIYSSCRVIFAWNQTFPDTLKNTRRYGHGLGRDTCRSCLRCVLGQIKIHEVHASGVGKERKKKAMSQLCTGLGKHTRKQCIKCLQGVGKNT